MNRDLVALPKAHLHLHFTGSMRPGTLNELAIERGIRLPATLREHATITLSADARGWFRFQRLYDAARAVVRDETAIRRLVREAVFDDAAEGSGWLELQVDPTSYAPFVGGLTPALEIILDEARHAGVAAGIEVGVVVAASRIRHPLEARTLARLAGRYAGDESGTVVGFGLSNDERRGWTADFGAAFAIAKRAGLASVPHSGELLGADHVAVTVAELAPDRIGHGVRSGEDPAVLETVVNAGIALEVCPGSNISLGVYDTIWDHPLRQLFDAGATIALSADDPLLFGTRLVDQYDAARQFLEFTDTELADLARGSIRASRAPQHVRRRLLAGVDEWLATVPGQPVPAPGPA